MSKEFFKWSREGRLRHIFNPSALGLFLLSVCLITTNNTQITRGQEIAVTLSYPPNIYIEIFLVGLVVQALFSVTLVTLSAGLTLYVLNVAYTRVTGFQFIDSNIPVPVFLGLHLLVTDPATSPYSAMGKIIFGAFYGVGVFGVHGVLSWLGAPQFYNKLLLVPALNLSVRALDRVGRAMDAHLQPPTARWRWSPRQVNFAHMALWILLFTTMMVTGFLRKY